MSIHPAAAASTLVAGHSRDPAAEHTLAVAADLARSLGARLHVVHVVTVDDYPVDPDAADWEDHARQVLAEHRARVARVLDARGVDWAFDVRHGNPADELNRAADEQDALLIVVGTRGEGPRAVVSRLLTPSVSHAVIGRQNRPVLVVPPPADDPGPPGDVPRRTPPAGPG